jgi:hypothetical protein
MSNSNLVDYTKISPNSSNPRKHKIDKITIHHMAGNLSVETCGEIFQPTERQASSNYGVGTDGRIGLYVEEKNRAWTSSNAANDNRAVTIEVANDGGDPDWHVSDKALEATIALCADICQRNGIAALNFTGDKSGNLTMHKWFYATACPGPYLESKFPYIAEEVNRRLKATAQPEAAKPSKPAAKTVDELAREVLAGKWGNGSERERRLVAAGYDYSAVQAKVDALSAAATKPEARTPKVGDIVNYTGKVHYSHANATSGSVCKPGKAKITAIYRPGKSTHPYHLVKVSGAGSTVYGWVDAGTFTKA